MGNCNKSQKEEFLVARNEKLESQLEKAEAEIKALKLEEEKRVHYLANTREVSTETTEEEKNLASIPFGHARPSSV